jgi:hypothetical protein
MRARATTPPRAAARSEAGTLVVCWRMVVAIDPGNSAQAMLQCVESKPKALTNCKRN